MTDGEWQACQNVTSLLTHLPVRPSPRKLRLFAVACCERVWPLLTDSRSRKAVKVAARFADGLASERERAAAYLAARMAADDLEASSPTGTAGSAGLRPDVKVAYHAAVAARNAVGELRAGTDLVAVTAAVWRARQCVTLQRSPAGQPLRPLHSPDERERTAQADLLRDLIGPTRPPAFGDAWRSATALVLARAIYEGRDFGSLPVLADALEEAGCESPLVLGHCRRTAHHARGCWVLDGLLGLT